MNILYIDHYAGSLAYGRSFRPYYLGQEWIKDGHKVFVIGSTFSHLRKRQPTSSGVEIIDGITYIWLKGNEYKGNGLKRAISMIVFTLQLLFNLTKILKISKPDAIIGSSVYMLDMFPAWIMKKFCSNRPKLILELHDIWPLTLIALGNMSRWHPFILLMRLAEWWAYKVSDKVISIIPGALEYMQKFGITKEKFSHVPNGVVVKDWENPLPLPEQHQQTIDNLHKENKFVIGYAGVYSLANNVHTIIEAALNLQAQGEIDITFVIIGDGPEKDNLYKMIKSFEINNVHLLPPINKASIPSFLGQMDVLCFHIRNKEIFYRYGISSNKIFDYMMAGKPVIQAARLSISNDLITNAGCGLTVLPDSAINISKAILKLRDMPKNELH